MNKESICPDTHLNIRIGNQEIDLHEMRDGPHIILQSGNDPLLTIRAAADLFICVSRRYSAKEINFCVLDSENELSLEESNIPFCAWFYHGADAWNLAMYTLEEETRRRQLLLRERDCSSQTEYRRKHNPEDPEGKMPDLILLICGKNQSPDQLAELNSCIRVGRSLGYHIIFIDPPDDPLLKSTIRQQICLKQIYTDQSQTTRPGLSQYSVNKDVVKANIEWEWKIRSHTGESRPLRLICGDLTKLQGPCDIVVCSAFKNNYYPTPTSLVGALDNKGYSISLLARHPEENLKFPNGWISRETGGDYRRIACIELLDLVKDDPGSEESVSIILKKSFSTLRYMLEQASYEGIRIHTLAMTIPGTGNQQINTCYILAPLISTCRYLLETNLAQSISIYDLSRKKITSDIIPAFNQAFMEKKKTPDVFISYSSKQQDLAHEIYNQLSMNEIECWIAPESIPEGSNYQEAIPDAISSVKILVLILTPESIDSKWVQKEVGSAIGSHKFILPYQMMAFDIGKQFMFLLDGEQIMYHKAAEKSNQLSPYSGLINRIREILDKENKIS